VGAPLFARNDPNGQAIGFAAGLARFLRGGRGRHPVVVVVGVVLVFAGVLAIIITALVSNLRG